MVTQVGLSGIKSTWPLARLPESFFVTREPYTKNEQKRIRVLLCIGRCRKDFNWPSRDPQEPQTHGRDRWTPCEDRSNAPSPRQMYTIIIIILIIMYSNQHSFTLIKIVLSFCVLPKALDVYQTLSLLWGQGLGTKLHVCRVPEIYAWKMD